MEEILVVAEHRKGDLRDITFEMLNFAQTFASQNQMKLTVLLLGQNISEMAGRLEDSCDNLLVLDAPELAAYSPDPYLLVIEKTMQERKSFLTLMGHTAAGMDLAPPLAARLSLPLMSDCLDAKLDNGQLEVHRQIYGGKINAHLRLKHFDQYLVTVRPGCFPASVNHDRSANKVAIEPPAWTEFRRRFLAYVEAELADVDITAADILVSVGRGIGKPENISAVQEFADAIGATLSCSRPVADKGWLPKSRQVGTSGKTVRPKVYIALGISGAFQHQAGMKNAETIIAVNKDARAPIFNVAHYGIVGDLFQVIPILKDKFS
ncbi:MAG: electron transfer flavoprotein subunit alpha/FixB family protein [Deltaproteobacteria bacterium]|nr:electron transfer flavoprotein subunit alpha/FixB family protein [Deltaproteobacteria bacterium]